MLRHKVKGAFSPCTHWGLSWYCVPKITTKTVPLTSDQDFVGQSHFHFPMPQISKVPIGNWQMSPSDSNKDTLLTAVKMTTTNFPVVRFWCVNASSHRADWRSLGSRQSGSSMCGLIPNSSCLHVSVLGQDEMLLIFMYMCVCVCVLKGEWRGKLSKGALDESVK